MTSKPKWLQDALAKDLIVSASATDTFMNICPRKWWLQKVRKLKTKAMKQHNFGMVLHEVIERWLEADELGNDYTGKPVNLYPDAWEMPESKYGEVVTAINSDEAILIRSLVSKAIDEGVLIRHPEVQAEKPINFVPVGDYGGLKVKATGSVDISAPGLIEDNKTSKSTRWLKSAKGLAEDVQMLFYAYLDQIKSNPGHPPTIILAHNQFVKDPAKPTVRKTSVEVTSKKIINFWNTKIAPAFEEMVRIRMKARCVFDIPEPSNPRACEAYGGCEFAQICEGRITENDFERNYLESLEQQQSTQKPQLRKENTTMSIFDNISKNKGNAKPKPKPLKKEEPKEKPEAKATEEPQAKGGIFGGIGKKKASTSPDNPKSEVKTKEPEADKPVKAKKAQQKIAPWYNEQCPACAENPILGFNTKMQPCRICDVKNRNTKGVPSTEFEITVADDGTITWEPETEAAAEAMEAKESGDSVKPVEVKAVEEKTETVQNVEDNNEETTETQEQQEEVEECKTENTKEEGFEEGTQESSDQGSEDPPEEQKKAPTRKPATKGRKKSEQVMLFINCAPVKGMTTISALALFQDICQEIANALGEEQYFALNVFERRDAMEQNIDVIVEERLLGKRVVAEMVCTSLDDYNLFVRSLIPRADIVVK